jgi:hypothetical protein
LEFKTGMPQGVFGVSGLIEYLREQTVEVMSLDRVQFCVGRLERHTGSASPRAAGSAASRGRTTTRGERDAQEESSGFARTGKNGRFATQLTDRFLSDDPETPLFFPIPWRRRL